MYRSSLCAHNHLTNILTAIDAPPTDADLTVASSLIFQELSATSVSTLHPSISTDYIPSYSPLLIASHEALANSTTAPPTARTLGTGIDLTRYAEPSAPSDPSTENWRDTLSTAYISHAYLSNRALNLSLLEKYGNNAWLVANSQVEDELKALERELSKVKGEVEGVEQERRTRMEEVRGEIEGLQTLWQTGVGRAIEVEVASESLRRQVLEKKRGGA